MIPVLIGLGVAGAAGAALLAGEDRERGQRETTEKRVVSEEYVKEQLEKSGRRLEE